MYCIGIEWGTDWDAINCIPTDTEFNNCLTQRYFEWNVQAHTDSYEAGRLLMQELLQIADSEAPRELGSSDLQLLSQPLSQWQNLEKPVSFWTGSFGMHLNCWRIVLGSPLFNPLGGRTAVAGIFETTRGGRRLSVVGCVTGPREAMWPANDQWWCPVSGRCPKFVAHLEEKQLGSYSNTWQAWAIARMLHHWPNG